MKLLALLTAVSLGQPDATAECLKRCAGEPKHADGKVMLACLTSCQRPAVDGGVELPAR